MDKPKEIFVTIPRMSCKRLTIIAKAMQLAKEGNRVTIFDTGEEDKILEPLGAKNILLQRKPKKAVKEEDNEAECQTME